MKLQLFDSNIIEIVCSDEKPTNLSYHNPKSKKIWIRIDEQVFYRWFDDTSFDRAVEYLVYQSKEDILEKLMDRR